MIKKQLNAFILLQRTDVNGVKPMKIESISITTQNILEKIVDFENVFFYIKIFKLANLLPYISTTPSQFCNEQFCRVIRCLESI